MKNDSLKCDELLIQNNEEKVETKQENKELHEFNTFLDQIENEINMQIKGLNDLKASVEGFRNRIRSGPNIPIQQNSPVIQAETKPAISDQAGLLDRLMALNKNNKNIKPNETGKAKSDESANLLEMLKKTVMSHGTSDATKPKVEEPAKPDDNANFLELLKNESVDTSLNKAKTGSKENLSLGEIEKQIELLKNLNIK
jgi:hypothetical protein